MNPSSRTVAIPFSTTGILLSINDMYIDMMYAFNLKFNTFANDGTRCTIYQFTRYALMQFERLQYRREYICSSFKPCSSYFMASECDTLNVKILTDLMETFGKFEYHGQQYATVLPPIDIISPYNIRLSNLRQTVELLSKEPNKAFEDQNTIPGAQFNPEHLLINPDDIMPKNYGEHEFRRDAMAVQSFLHSMRNVNVKFELCDLSFSGTGKPSTAVTYRIEAGNYMSIPNTLQPVETKPTIINNFNLRHVDFKSQRYYSILLIDELMFAQGIVTCCGIYDDALAAKWSDLVFRHPANACQYREYWRLMCSKVSINSLNSVGTIPIPFSTTGILFHINDMYSDVRKRFRLELEKLEKRGRKFTVHQFTRYTLAQFEYLQRERFCLIGSYFPDPFRMNDDFMRRVAIFTKNFQILADVMESFGQFRHNGQEYATVVPPIDIVSPYNIRLSNLRQTVELLSREPNNEFEDKNTIPGAQFNSEHLLVNADDIMPSEYGQQEFINDALAMQDFFAAVELAKGDLSYYRLGRVKFLGKGKPSTAVTVHMGDLKFEAGNSVYDRIPNVLIATEPLDPRLDRSSETNSVKCEEQKWYSIFRICESMFKKGTVAYSGIYDDALAAQWPATVVAHPVKAHQISCYTWNKAVLFYNKTGIATI